MRGGTPVGKVGRQNGQLPFVLHDQCIDVGGKGGPDSGDDQDDTALDPPVCGEVSSREEDQPYAGHHNHADDRSGLQSFHIP